jgi:uncharacterized protein (DUF302 family)
MRDELITVSSEHPVHDTVDRLVHGIENRGLRVFARIDHAANAADSGLELRPTELVIFGHPRGGTPLMQDCQTVGLELPFKALVWEDKNARVWLTYADPDCLAARHGLGAASTPVIAAIKAGVEILVESACHA